MSVFTGLQFDTRKGVAFDLPLSWGQSSTRVITIIAVGGGNGQRKKVNTNQDLANICLMREVRVSGG